MAKSHVVKVKLIGNDSAKFGAIFVTSERIVLRLCKIKRLNSNSFVLRLRYLQILFPPWSPLFQQPILCCVPLLGFMVSAPRFKIQSYCPLFSLCWGRIRFTNHKNIDHHTKITTKKGEYSFYTLVKKYHLFGKNTENEKVEWNENGEICPRFPCSGIPTGVFAKSGRWLHFRGNQWNDNKK